MFHFANSILHLIEDIVDNAGAGHHPRHAA